MTTETTTTQATTTTAPTTEQTVAQVGIPNWLPGVDADTASFITGKTVADLPSLAKGYVEAQRALSQPRGFEVPKEGDVEGWKKFNAAIGVPETPDKYDFGEPGKAMTEDAKKLWTAEMHKLGIPNKQAAALVNLVSQQSAALTQQQTAAAQARIDEGVTKLKSEWGDKYDANYDLANRGWVKVAGEIGWSKEMMDAVERIPGGTRAIHQLGLVLGRHTVEAGFVVQDGQHKGVTKEGAVAELQAMMGDGHMRKALTDKNHADHQRILARKIQLENIAHA